MNTESGNGKENFDTYSFVHEKSYHCFISLCVQMCKESVLYVILVKKKKKESFHEFFVVLEKNCSSRIVQETGCIHNKY